MKGFYFAILAAIVWGIAPVVEKIGLKNIEPLSGVLVRSSGVIIGAVIMAIFNTGILKTALKADPKAIVFLFMGGILASILGQIFFYNALKHGEVSKMVPVAATYPLVSFLLGMLFFGESFTIAKGLGIGFIILGVFFLR
ncbi:MAG: EamA family transporter [Candidatus Omnitrophica bacterium]|nr:EamA family transporter [Candidatus Omnitrophota bacterium]